MRYRQIHNIWGLYAGPNNPTGYHYADYNGERHNNPQLSIFDENLLKDIDRVSSFRYDISVDRENFTQLGTKGLIKRAIVNLPTINFDFNYYLVGVRNEDRLGFVVNYPNITGQPILDQETSFFSNFTGWSTDCRNIFLGIAPNDIDINKNIGDQFTNSILHPSGIAVIGFGNCYVQSYAFNASVGAFPEANVGYTCENVIVLASGSGAQIPAILPKSGHLVSGVKFTIPRYDSPATPSVIRPGDINLKIGSFNNSNFYETTEAIFGVNSSGLNIQSFNIRANLDREALKSIGYYGVIDRRLNHPILVDIDITTIIDNHRSGNLAHFLHRNESYDLLINMYNPSCTSREVALQYKIRNAKFTNVNYSHEVYNKLIGNFKFSAEIEIGNRYKDMYVSGILNETIPEFPYNYLRLEANKTGFLYTEEGNLLIVGEN